MLKCSDDVIFTLLFTLGETPPEADKPMAPRLLCLPVFGRFLRVRNNALQHYP